MIYTIEQARWQLDEVSYIVSKRHELWSTNALKLDRNFHPPSENSAEFRTRTLDHRTQPNFATRKAVNNDNKLS